MPSWNVALKSREDIVRVKKILNRKPDFMVVQLSNGKQQKLCNANFPEWKQVEGGDRIRLVIHESVVGAIHVPEPFSKRVQEFLYDLKEGPNELFFMWSCEECRTMGRVVYEDGEEFQGVARRINIDHRKKIKPGCNKTKLKIYDHRGMPRQDSAFSLSLMR